MYPEVTGNIHIYLRNEDLTMNLLKDINLSEQPGDIADKWQSVLVKLTDTDLPKQIVVKFIKAVNNFSGLAIDDLSVRPCPDFSKSSPPADR